MEGFYKILEKYHMEKWFQKENLVILVLVGILLIVIALPTKKGDSKKESVNVYAQTEVSETAAAEESTEENMQDNTQEYVEQLEKKLEEILSQIKGAGSVNVMITLQQSEELVVEKDMIDENEQTIYQSEGNKSVPYVVKMIFPKVEGVVVIAQGAGTGKVTQHITEAIQALFPIELHKIKVTGS